MQIQTTLLAGIYRHYKGPLYLVLGYAHDANADTLLYERAPGMIDPLGERTVVVYVPLQFDGAHTGARMAVRTAEDFFAQVHPDGSACSHKQVRTLTRDGDRQDCLETHVDLVKRFTYIGATWEGQ